MATTRSKSKANGAMATQRHQADKNAVAARRSQQPVSKGADNSANHISDETTDHLSNLPPELRAMIWDLVVLEPYPILISNDKGSTPAVARTNSTYRSEILPIFFNRNEFIVRVSNTDIRPIEGKLQLYMEWYGTSRAGEEEQEDEGQAQDNTEEEESEDEEESSNIVAVGLLGTPDFDAFRYWVEQTWLGKLPVLYAAPESTIRTLPIMASTSELLEILRDVGPNGEDHDITRARFEALLDHFIWYFEQDLYWWQRSGLSPPPGWC